MRKIGLILAGCLAFIGLQNAHADDIGDAVRAAYRRDTAVGQISSRQKVDSVTADSTSRKASNTVVRNTPTSARSATVVNRSAEQTTTTPINVVARPAVTQKLSNTGAQKQTTRSTKSTVARSGTRTTTARSATRSTTKVATREDILKRDYSKCKEVFNECMDEFCANKDSQLKRCACSARIHDFDKIKKQLADIDEKMLDFNQRLLTVSMDAEDVAAINVATEGEEAFYGTKDVSASKKALDEIAKKLNTSFDNSNFSTTLGSALSWTLDIDSAFDSVDSLRGASTAAKSGTALYSAALPVCREMAAEVCSEEDVKLAENGYQVLIEQACDTVEKTYKTAAQQARTKVLGSSALLDVSRLEVYQKNNSDDILTCKRKMLSMLTDSTVCGDDLGKCLDITGQYIDPTTGEAFLSSDLANLANLITRPEGEETWTKAPGNSVFVEFLNSRKKFLEPAMEHCQDIADTVWDAFIEDALSQIKIAQIRKLEDVRQGCTTLTAQCLTNANDSIVNFDARALSIFGVAADTTANAMCESVLSSCTTLLDTTGIISATDREWYQGMTGIQNDITYETIKHTCREVGRACIIQVCTSTSGNFGLCENIDTSINRKSIINHTACWDEVKACVQSAGEDATKKIFEQNSLDAKEEGSDTYLYTLYSQLYGINNPQISNLVLSGEYDEETHKPIYEESSVTKDCKQERNDGKDCFYDMCYDECDANAYKDTNKCRICRLAENIWGNCETPPTTPLELSGSHNRIKQPNDGFDTLLYWFARNTNTQDAADSCRDTTCGIGFIAVQDPITNAVMCVDENAITDDGIMCNIPGYKRIYIRGERTSPVNCCTTGIKDKNGNCCNSKQTNNYHGYCIPDDAKPVATFTMRGNNAYYPNGYYKMYCTGELQSTGTDEVTCTGRFIIIHYLNPFRSIRYMDPNYNTTASSAPPYTKETFMTTPENTYTHTYDNDNSWKWLPEGSGVDEPQNWMVSFGEQ